mmetsp:Transcript_8814/g.21984  ORF Transcript_8814/g.21984 Transcript_8814/m.21984 type:complete len:99 (-) Transcript_8814:786-1082(-)
MWHSVCSHQNPLLEGFQGHFVFALLGPPAELHLESLGYVSIQGFHEILTVKQPKAKEAKPQAASSCNLLDLSFPREPEVVREFEEAIVFRVQDQESLG